MNKMVAKLLDGKELSKEIRNKLKQRVTVLKEKGITPKLAVILVGEDEASKVYVHNKHRAAEKIGIETIDIKLAQDITEKELLLQVRKYNEDDSIHGILVQLPLPKQISEEKVTCAIAPEKDVDGFHPVNIGHLFMNNPHSLPCTPHGIMKFFEKYELPIAGKNVVIVGRSNIVGRPMAAMMLNNDATVTITHSKTKNLSEFTRQADILIAAVGHAAFIKKNDVKPGAVIIDVGMNRNDKGKLVGDVEQKGVSEVASYITPVPGGVGPMTIAMLMEQTVKFAERGVQIGNRKVSNG